MLIDANRPPPAPAMVEELRARLRLPDGFEEDAALTQRLTALLDLAVAVIEARTARALIRRRFTLRSGALDAERRLALPREPVRAVASVVIERTDGGRESLPPSAWRLTAERGRPMIALPTPQLGPDGFVEIDFEAGDGPLWTDAPIDLRKAVIETAASRFEADAEAAVSAGPSLLPTSALALLEPYRRIRL